MIKTLSDSEKQLITIWKQELVRTKIGIENLLNEVYNSRLAKLAEGLGIDLKSQNWIFDDNQMAFIEKVESEAPKDWTTLAKKAAKKISK